MKVMYLNAEKGMDTMMNEVIRKLYSQVHEIKKAFKIPNAAVDAKLRDLAKSCGKGDAAAMMALSEYLHTKIPEEARAINMWLLRAAVYGNVEAQERVREAIKQNNRFLETSLIPYGHFIPDRRANWHIGSFPGQYLNAVGLLAFQPKESYLIAGIDSHRAMLIWREADYEPADEDGFGAETYYDMFYLDEFFQPIPGVPVVKSVSTRDIKNLSGPKEEYEAMVHAMVEATGKGKQVPIWTGLENVRRDRNEDV